MVVAPKLWLTGWTLAPDAVSGTKLYFEKPTVYNVRFYVYAATVLSSTYTHMGMEITAIA